MASDRCREYVGATVYAAYFTALVLVGMAVVSRAPLGVRTGRSLTLSLLIVTSVGSALLAWRTRLRAPLSEVAATPPLPVPLDFVVETLGVVLLTSGPLAGGALLMLSCREAGQGSRLRGFWYFCCLLYVVHWAPRIAESIP